MTTETRTTISKQFGTHRWGMVVDVDRCTGCQACVIACQAENNIPLNLPTEFDRSRAIAWIRIERYWEGEFPDVKARYIPVLCQHCANAPCEPVCPVYATYHNAEGLNVQVYNRCVGTKYCANGCPYIVRFFNWYEPVWPETFRNHLNPDVTVRSRGIMEKCSFCMQRIRRGVRQAIKDDKVSVEGHLPDGYIQTACQQACPTDALIFGDFNDPESRVAKVKAELKDHEGRAYRLLENLNTDPAVIYLAAVDPDRAGGEGAASHG
jgi:molybdopterin-containing oxidoreductase family iron-sulfur binding subunit